MSIAEADPKPLPATVAVELGHELDIPRAKRVFVNRNLKMEDIQLIGFDMDYTLAIYHQAEMERLSIELTLRKLVENRGYPPAIRTLDYPPERAIRGVVVDRQNGNIFKMDRHGHVGRVFHGLRALTHDERAELYRRERIRLSSPRYAWIDTLFALPEAVMYQRLVDYLEAERPGKIDYSALWQDVRECIDEAHRDDSLKRVIRADLPRFIYADEDLPATLHKLRSSGKRLFLLTNSMWDYTDHVMRYVLDAKLPAYTSWRSYFDIIIVGGTKPAFFTDHRPFLELDPATGKVMGEAKGLYRGHVYEGGNLGDFETRTGIRGDHVLYVGDHIYGDILRAKKSSVWRTAMIVQELEGELNLSERFAPRLRQLDEIDRKRRNLDAEVDYQQLMLRTLARLADEEGANMAAIESARRRARQTLDELRGASRETSRGYDLLEQEVDLSYNAYWGPLFKEGNENSRFGEQVEDYACLYTSRVSNFLAYSPLRYFRAPRAKMPHER
jgi:HAD superfamily 5'-nucleotidase-like hydrolase